MTFTGWKVTKAEAKALLAESHATTKALTEAAWAAYVKNEIGYTELYAQIGKAAKPYNYLEDNLVIRKE